MTLRIGLAQINVTVGDMGGNSEMMVRMIRDAKSQIVNLLVFPELCICGYPPEDLLHKPKFMDDNESALETLLGETKGLTVIAGYAQGDQARCFNAAAVLSNQKVEQVYQKGLLPNYGVFDEKRYFTPGQTPVIIERKGLRIAITICEDIWDLNWQDEFLDDQKKALDLVINLSASPFHAGKNQERQEVLAQCARHFNCPVAYCNLVGGQDELVFDGRSMFVDAQGDVVAQAKEFQEDLCITDLEGQKETLKIAPVNPSALCSEPLDEVGEVYL